MWICDSNTRKNTWNFLPQRYVQQWCYHVLHTRILSWPTDEHKRMWRYKTCNNVYSTFEVGLYIGCACKCGGEMMCISAILRSRLKLAICVSLFLMLFVFFWPRRVELATPNSSFPAYPSAQKVRSDDPWDL